MPSSPPDQKFVVAGAVVMALTFGVVFWTFSDDPLLAGIAAVAAAAGWVGIAMVRRRQRGGSQASPGGEEPSDTPRG